ncbi:MAG: HYR domain-containing protein, partial [Bacteroidales bacterium]|nr:HYR domain-containing protein [Bacteroidales bacterium]
MNKFTNRTLCIKSVSVYVLILAFLLISSLGANAQLLKSFSSRYPVQRIRGDFTLIGNKNLTVLPYSDNSNNGYVNMVYVNVDGGSGIINSSSANLVFSTENNANPAQTEIKFAGLYWTGRSHRTMSPMEFTVSGVTLNKSKVLLKGPGATSYTNIVADSFDIYYPDNQDGNMFSAFADVTNYVKGNSGGTGQYSVANIALNEDVNTDGTGYYGGWALIVVYENHLMNFRDIVIFDGHAYVAGGITADFTIPVNGLITTQTGPVNMKLGMLAGEGDRSISGDYFQIRNHANTNWVSLSHPENATTNFFNSSIYSYTNGVQNPRNPSYLNNFGLDISMFNINNPSNSVITNYQTSTTFRYGTTQDTYIIYCIAMAVDAYIPEIFLNKTAVPNSFSAVGNQITYTFLVENTGNYPLTNVVVVDTLLGVTFGPISLNPGQSHTFTYNYTITQSDMDAGQILNTASTYGWANGIEYSYDDSEIVIGTQQPGINVSKIANPTTYNAIGNVITYTIVVSNTGNVTLTDVLVIDPLTGLNNTIPSLAPGASQTFIETYTITPSDMYLSEIPNIVTATGNDPNDNPVSDTDNEIIINVFTEIIAEDDNLADINGCSGQYNILNVLDNDIFDGQTANLSEVIISVTVPDPFSNLMLNPNGFVSLTAGTQPGIYTLTYQICEILNPTNCDDAVVTVTVIDIENPTIICPSNITIPTDPGVCYAGNVALGTPIVNDNCINVSISNNAPAQYPIGTTVVTWTVTDGSGHSVSCNQTVTVVDIENPTISCPSIVTVHTDPNMCSASNVNLGIPSVDDNCSIISVTNNAPAVFPLGVTIVTWVVTDGAGNTASCQQAVKIVDYQLPSIICPPNLTISTDANICSASNVNLGSPAVSDNCSIVNISNNAPSIFPIGTTIVKWTVTDGAGNTASCVQIVTVVDNVNPSIICPANVTVYTDNASCSATNVTLGTPSVNDNCTIVSITNNAPSIFPIGTTIVTWTVTDGAGNTATCNQTVTVEDNENPSIICPPDVTVIPDAGICSASNVILGTPSVDDNCTIVSITNNAPSIFPIGTTIVTWTVTDGAGNTATCNQTVTVEDNENPSIICPPDVTVTPDAGICSASNVTLGTPSVYDNCTIVSVTNNAPLIFPIGTTIVTWTVTDGAGNTATCNQTVTVEDNENPTIICPANITVSTDANVCSASNVTLGTPSVDDNCTIVSITNNAPSIFPIGTTIVTWTVTDGAGNTATCNQTVTVEDNENPSIICPPDVTVIPDAG